MLAPARWLPPTAAVLEACRLDGDDVTVEVSVAGPRVPWRDVRVTAEARAGRHGPGVDVEAG